MNLTIPANVNIFIGVDSKSKVYKSVVTTDNPYLKINDILSIKTDAPDMPSRWGIGITGGVGVPLFNIRPGVFVNLGLTYSLIRF
jgi:hypothetical protein